MEPIPKAEFSIVTRTSAKAWLPALIASAGPEVTETYIDFFTATIRNRNTRQAYARACWQFFDWCAAHGLELTTVRFWCKLLKGSVSCDNCRDDGTDLGTRVLVQTVETRGV